MSHGIYHLEPNQEELSQLAAIVLPAQPNRVGGVMQGPGTLVADDGTLTLAPATASVVGGVKQGPNNSVAADGTLTTLPGTVTSVALSMPGEFTVAGSPITASGTFAVTRSPQPANQIWAGPASGATAQPGFRALVQADIPWLKWQNYTPTIVSDGPYTPTWTITQYRSDGVTVDIALVFTATVQKQRTTFQVSWPVAPLTTGWPLRAVMPGSGAACYAYIDIPNGGITVAITSGTMPTGAQLIHVDGRYRVS